MNIPRRFRPLLPHRSLRTWTCQTLPHPLRLLPPIATKSKSIFTKPLKRLPKQRLIYLTRDNKTTYQFLIVSLHVLVVLRFPLLCLGYKGSFLLKISRYAVKRCIYCLISIFINSFQSVMKILTDSDIDFHFSPPALPT